MKSNSVDVYDDEIKWNKLIRIKKIDFFFKNPTTNIKDYLSTEKKPPPNTHTLMIVFFPENPELKFFKQKFIMILEQKEK